MLKRLALALSLTLAFSSAHAAPAVCADLFRTQPSLVSRAVAPVKRVVEPVSRLAAPFVKPVTIPAVRIASEVSSLVKRLTAPRFKIERFDEALEFYRGNGGDAIDHPNSREARLALFTYVSQAHGRDPYELEAMARNASPKEFKALVKLFHGANPEKGFSPAQIDSIYWKLFNYSVTSPNSLKMIAQIARQQGRKGVFEKIDRIALEQWTTKEMASHSAVEAFERLGLIRDQGMRGRMMDVIRNHPNVTKNLVIGGLMLIEKQILGSPISAPQYSRLRVTKLAEEIRTLVEEQGFDAAYPILKQRYGHLAQFDRRFYFARRAVSVGLMGYMLMHLIPTIVHGVVPEHILKQDLNAVEMTSAIVRYYSDLTTAIVSDRVYGTDERAIEIRVQGAAAAKPHVEIAAAGSVKAPPPIDLNKISANRVTITFDQQIALEKQKPKKAKAVPTTELGTAEQSAKALDDNLDYLNSLDFSAPTER